MPTFRAPRGTRDILPSERPTWGRLERIASDLAARYGYREIETPLFEQTAVFERGVGEATDVVEKELFRIAARRDESESWALRPEPTAGIVRAYVQHGMQTWPQPVKLTLTGPMFRYDRPQAGRYREFWQWDVEAIGDPGPAVDAELIELGLAFFRTVGLPRVDVLVNSIGDPACRPAYVEDLVSYYRSQEACCPRSSSRGSTATRSDCSIRRIRQWRRSTPRRRRSPTGCASPAPSTSVRSARTSTRSASATASSRRSSAGSTTTPARPSSSIRAVREGQQSAIGGGGRYDGLVELLGGRPTPGIGFGIGLDRVVLALQAAGVGVDPEPPPLAVVVGADPAASAQRLKIASDLRAAGLSVRAELGGRRLGKALEAAVRDKARFAVIVGDELADGRVGLRDLNAGDQKLVAVADLARELERGRPTRAG